MAAELNPADILQKISNAVSAQQLHAASSLADAALLKGVRHPLVYTAKALQFSHSGNEEAAIVNFRRAQAISPPKASLESAIGLCLLKLGRADEAVIAFASAVALEPHSAQLHCRKGWAHELNRELDMAQQEHELAVALQPRFAESLGRLAYLAAQRGSEKQAQTLAERALAENKDQPTAHLAMAQLEIQRGEYGSAETRLQKLINDSSTTRTDRHSLSLGLLADLRDRQDQTSEAFHLYGRSNSEFAALHKQHPLSRIESMGEAVITLTKYMDQWESVLSPTDDMTGNQYATNHVFILGFLRSGTTLIEQILASNSKAVTLGEDDTLQDATFAFMENEKSLGSLWSANEIELEKYRALYWARVRRSGIDPTGKTFVDKVPINTIKIPLIARLFPEARTIFALRDPRDVVLSCFRNRFQFNAVTREFFTLENTAKFYAAVMQLAECYRQKIGFKELIVRHEDMVDNFDFQVSRICAFVNLPVEEGMRSFAMQAGKRAISTVSAPQLARGLNADGVGRWRRYSSQLEPAMPILMPWVEKFGYAEI